MSIANKVRLYLENKPYILEALEKDIVNLSKLSRKIQKELKIDNLTAIKAAVRRFSEQLKKQKHRREERVLAILKQSTISFHDGVNVAIATSPLKVKARFTISLDDAIVYLLDKSERLAKERAQAFHENCGMFIIKSPLEIEKTPGVIAYLTSLLTEHNINVIEFISCYTYTILIIDRKDVSRAYEILSRVIG